MRFQKWLGVLLTGVILLLGACGSSPIPVVQPPSALSYTTSTAVYTKGTAIPANNPTSAGGAVTSYSVSPALPGGLSLSSTTGVISGTPTAITATANYTVTATNVAGSATAALSITGMTRPPRVLRTLRARPFTLWARPSRRTLPPARVEP